MGWEQRAADIRVCIFDVDGVMTDGRLGYLGEQVIKFFDVQDGSAMRMAMRAGLHVGIISGRPDPATLQRAEELGLSFAHTGIREKTDTLQVVLAELGLEARQCLYMGDDLLDIAIMKAVGIAAAVPNAAPEVLSIADVVTEARGGHGAVRELLRRLLQARGDWAAVLTRYGA